MHIHGNSRQRAIRVFFGDLNGIIRERDPTECDETYNRDGLRDGNAKSHFPLL